MREVALTSITPALPLAPAPAAVHLELSRASDMRGGFVTEYFERVLLPKLDPRGFDGLSQPSGAPGEPPVDFVVTAR